MAAPSGTKWGGISSNNYSRIGLHATVANANETTATITVQVWYWSRYSTTDSNNTLYIDQNPYNNTPTTSKGSITINTTVNSGSGWSTSNQQKLGTYTFSASRGNGASTTKIYAKFSNVEAAEQDLTCNVTVSVPSKALYTVIYNANGGSGAPSDQDKYYGQNLVLSSTKPTRTGYTFQGWGTTSADTTVRYNPGSTYSANANITLYAIWKIITYTITYNANGGSGAPGSQTKKYGTALTLSRTIPSRSKYNFEGWHTSSTATTKLYSAGGSYTANAAATLYAVWSVAYVDPRIVNLKIDRCDQDGTLNDSGTYAKVSCDWECDNTITSIKFEALDGSTVVATSTLTPGGTSSTTSNAFGNGLLDVEKTYTIRVTVTDSGGSANVTGTLGSMRLTIDFLAGGKGVAFGKAAELEGVAEFDFDGKFNKPVYGKALGMDRLPQIPSNSDLNNYMEPGCYAVHSNAIAETVANIPVARAGRLEVWSSTGEGIRTEQWSYIRQRYVPYNDTNPVWERDIARSSDNVWDYYPWFRTSLTTKMSSRIYETGGKILWGGDMTSGMYMTSGHTATLSEPVSAQLNGIVLVFCYYNGTSDTNYNFQQFFVSKLIIESNPGAGHTFELTRTKRQYVGAKYLYINNNTIVGHDDNNASGVTTNADKYDNNKFVLRYVFGV